MLREMTLNEIKECNECEGELGQTMIETAKKIENGEKVMVKEKITAKGKSYVFYKYDRKLYRYQIVGEIFA